MKWPFQTLVSCVIVVPDVMILPDTADQIKWPFRTIVSYVIMFISRNNP